MLLGEIISALEKHPSPATVLFDDGTVPYEFASWRGIYSHLTLLSRHPSDGVTTVETLLARARAADGADFPGYKGDLFRMDRWTQVWADPYGECNRRGIVDLLYDGVVRVILRTAHIP